jgi:uncharacterized damage-inducible protein DinB
VELREFLVSPVAYLAPEKAIEGLTTADAERRLSSVQHSVAEVIAHLSFWQDWFHARCVGAPKPMVGSAAAGWPAVAAGSWPDLQSRFVRQLHQLGALAEGDVMKPVTPAIEFPPLTNYTIADALVHVATHNAHHIGQVIVMRQLMGAWPPPAGSWTW